MPETAKPPTPDPPGSSRSRADACPGAVTMHEAADGSLARIRVPGGILSASTLLALAGTATDLGDGRLELTSRANIQIRGLDAAVATQLATRLRSLGLLPSLQHERVRNILASPLSGLDSVGHADTTELVKTWTASCARALLWPISPDGSFSASTTDAAISATTQPT
jgi:precorrin-3B synthase